MRKIMSLFIAVMLVFSMTACTSSTENTTPTDVQETTEITTTVTTENEKKPAPKNDNYLLYQKINYFPNGEIAYKVDYAYSKDYKLSQIQEIMYNPGYMVLSKIITTFEQYDANGNPTAGYI